MPKPQRIGKSVSKAVYPAVGDVISKRAAAVAPA